MTEAAYKGNIGMMEMFKFYQKASNEQKAKMKQLITDEKFDEAWKFLQEVTGVKLHEARQRSAFDRWAAGVAAENRAKQKVIKDKEKLERAAHSIATRVPRPTAKKKPTSPEIWHVVETAISNSFPDGDPIDQLIGYMKKHDLTMDEIDGAVKKHAGVKKGFYGYLAQMWDDFARDQIGDAKRGHVEHHSPFYTVSDDGKIEPEQNPWKTN